MLEIIDETFDGVFQGELPSHTEISNWAQKNGLATYIETSWMRASPWASRNFY